METKFLKKLFFLLIICVSIFIYNDLHAQNTRKIPMITNQWQNILIGISAESDVKGKLGKPDEEIINVNYASMKNIKYISYDTPSVAFFIENDKIILIHIEPDSYCQYPNELADWKDSIEEPEVILPSVHGKNIQIYLYPDKGLAPVFNEYNQLIMVELFESMTSENYKKKFYRIPPKFVK